MSDQDQLNRFDDIDRQVKAWRDEAEKYRNLYFELLTKEIDVMDLLVKQAAHLQKHLVKPLVFRTLLGKVLREYEIEGAVSNELILEIEEMLKKY